MKTHKRPDLWKFPTDPGHGAKVSKFAGGVWRCDNAVVKLITRFRVDKVLSPDIYTGAPGPSNENTVHAFIKN